MKPRTDVDIGGVDDLFGIVVPPSQNHAVGDRQVDFLHLAGNHIDELAPAQAEIRRTFPLRSLDPAAQTLTVVLYHRLLRPR